MHTMDVKPVEVLNTLIGINNERIEGYNYAAKEIDATIFKVLFNRLTETSFICRHELIKEVQKLGGKPTDGIAPPGDCFRAWLDVISAVSRKDHKAILNSCTYQENVVIKSYEIALNQEEEINSQQQRLLNRQYDLLKADYVKVKNLLDVLVKSE